MPKNGQAVKIAITYNATVGGSSVYSLQAFFEELGAEVSDADYRSIVPASNDLDAIYQNEEQRIEAFGSAKMNAELFLADKHCLILSGANSMIDPRLQGDQFYFNKKIDLARNLAEIALIHVALQKGMPIMGICAGHQILNVYFGGKVDALSDQDLSRQRVMDYAGVKVVAQSELGSIVNQINIKQRKSANHEREMMEEFFGGHHEAVKEIGGKKSINHHEGSSPDDYLMVSARATDGSSSVEAVESKYGVPVMGVQFHPEIGAKGFIDKKAIVKTISKLMYEAETDESIQKSMAILKTFKQAAEAYKNKQNLLKTIKSQEIGKNEISLNEQENLSKPKRKNTFFLKKWFFEAVKFVVSIIRKLISINLTEKTIADRKQAKHVSNQGDSEAKITNGPKLSYQTILKEIPVSNKSVGKIDKFADAACSVEVNYGEVFNRLTGKHFKHVNVESQIERVEQENQGDVMQGLSK